MPIDYQPTGDYGSDGLGFPQTVVSNAVRIYAKEVAIPRSTSIRLTGLTTGATWNILITVNPGEEVTIESPIPIF